MFLSRSNCIKNIFNSTCFAIRSRLQIYTSLPCPSPTSVSFEIFPNARSLLHTSSILSRNLDNRLSTPSREPSKKTGKWDVLKSFKERYDYTTRKLPHPKTGGRGPNGHIWTHRIGGGHKRKYRMIDHVRNKNIEGDLVERIKKICYDPNRTGRIALTANGEHKRYIMATESMKAGDLLTSSVTLTDAAIRPQLGNSYPVGSLPVNTIICCVRPYLESDLTFVVAAGTSATLIRKLGDQCVIRLPSRREICVDSRCQVVVGRISNGNHNKIVIGKAGRNRWKGIRPRSGRFHLKDGRFGRKIRPLKPMKVYRAVPPPKPEFFKFTD